jgi:SAM-dependent methyltransferase
MTLRDAWETEARNWIAWARKPGHDSYWTFHRDVFLAGLPQPPARIVDLGCGEGRLPRDLRRLGYEVVGIDPSPTLVAAAREADPGGDYRVADAARVPLPDASVDLVTAFMTPQDIDDLDAAMDEAFRLLRPGGHLRTAAVHPINSAGGFAGGTTRNSRAPEAPFEIRDSYFEQRRYEDSIERDGLPMTFTSLHRDLEQLAGTILNAGFLIDRLVEVPDSRAPAGSRWRRIPLFIHLGAVKPGGPRDVPGA